MEEDGLALADAVRTLSTAAASRLPPDAARALREALSVSSVRGGTWADPLGLGCTPPDLTICLPLAPPCSVDAAVSSLLTAADELFCGQRSGRIVLPWKEPKDLSESFSSWASGTLRSAMLIGDVTYGASLLEGSVYSGVWWLQPHTRYPCHAHAADEFFIVLSGSSAQWRLDSPEWHARGKAACRNVDVGEVLVIPSGVAHSVTTFDEPLLVWYLWTGQLKGAYWFCDHAEALPAAMGVGERSRGPSEAGAKRKREVVEPRPVAPQQRRYGVALGVGSAGQYRLKLVSRTST